MISTIDLYVIADQIMRPFAVLKRVAFLRTIIKIIILYINISRIFFQVKYVEMFAVYHFCRTRYVFMCLRVLFMMLLRLNIDDYIHL